MSRSRLSFVAGGWLALLLAIGTSGTAATAEFARTAPAQVGLSAERLARLDDYMKHQVASGHLPGPVDAFLDGVFVNSDVPAERDSRLKTLAAVRDAMGQVADFSLIGG